MLKQYTRYACPMVSVFVVNVIVQVKPMKMRCIHVLWKCFKIQLPSENTLCNSLIDYDGVAQRTNGLNISSIVKVNVEKCEY